MDAMLIGLVAVATVTGVAVLPWSEPGAGSKLDGVDHGS